MSEEQEEEVKQKLFSPRSKQSNDISTEKLVYNETEGYVICKKTADEIETDIKRRWNMKPLKQQDESLVDVPL